MKPKSHIEPKSALDELSAIVRSIKLSNKYYLYFVACNQTPRQNELIAEVKAKLPKKNIEVIKFKKPVTNLLSELKPLLNDKKPDAIFIQGLESSISSDGIGKENALIHSLNLTRDAFNDALPCPMYLWIPEYALIKMTRHAPDFFSVRSGVFYFSSPAKQVIADIFQNTSSDWLEISSLFTSEKQQRIANLESLLGEYQGLHQEKRDKRVEMRLYGQLADLFYTNSDYHNTIKYYMKALKTSREINDRKTECNSLGNLGKVYYKVNNYKQSIKYYTQALKLSEEINDKQNETIFLSNLRRATENLDDEDVDGNYEIGRFEQAAHLSSQFNNVDGVVNALGNLGTTYLNLCDYDKAIEFYEKSLKKARETGYKQKEIVNLVNLGDVYKILDNYPKMIEYYEQSLNISREIGDRQNEGNQLGNLANAYRNLGEKDKAREYYKQALAIFEAIHSPNAEVIRQNLAIY